MSKVSRKKVAEEAAWLLYLGFANEYKDAKEQASKNLNLSFLPSNFEVAEHLDEIAELMEVEKRYENLVSMRKTALEIMRLLEKHKPKLIGSVWRGTINKKSDIDISLYSNEEHSILELLKERFGKLNVTKPTYVSGRKTITVTNIKTVINDYNVEIVIRDPKDEVEEYCEIYGDTKMGLTLAELENVMENDPLRRLVPKRRT
jgi:predicted nucleotidyltransferase